MITGFNTDVDYNGCVYHVQTEDRGMDHPIIESLVYTGGEIVASRKNPYTDLVASGCYSEEALMRRMEAQHRELMREIRDGKFGGDEVLKPFGHAIVTNRTFDEVVSTFLAEQLASGAIALETDAPARTPKRRRSRSKVAASDD
jgi:hypothetical protein